MKNLFLIYCLLAPLLVFSQDSPQQNVEAFTDSIRLHPSFINYVRRGQAYEQLTAYARAIQDFNIAIRMRPYDPGPYDDRGNCYLYFGNPDSAETDFTKAIELDNYNVLAYSGRGIAYFNLDNPDAAITDFTMAYQINHNFALYNRGYTYLAKGDYDSANNDLRVVIAKDTINGRKSSWAYPCYLLSLVYQRDFITADNEYKLYKKNNINSFMEFPNLSYLKTYLEICTTDLKSHNYRAGLSALESLTKTGFKSPEFAILNNQIKGNYAEIVATKAWVYEKMDSLGKALEFYQKAAVLNIHNNYFSEKIQQISDLITKRNRDAKTPPTIDLFAPLPEGDNIVAKVDHSGNLFISGKATNPAGISEIKVNDVPITQFGSDGSFQQAINLNADKLVITAADKNGNRANKEYHIVERVLLPDDGKVDIKPDDIGKYYAIFIACAKYTAPGLDTLPTISEANSLRKILIEKYNFLSENIDTIYDADRGTIVTNLDSWMQKIGPNDNLVIFYGGHGTYNPTNEAAFWIPLKASDRAGYITNPDITGFLNDCKAKHILILADACFSGAIRSGFATPTYFEFKLPSRQIMTSGGIARVPGNSAFINAVVNVLNVSHEPYLSATELFTLIFATVKNANHGTIPSLRDMQAFNSGAGQFYFQKK